jgi:hypothetical protein
MGDERGLGRDIRFAARASARQAQDQALRVLWAVARCHLEGVIEAAVQQSAFDRARQAIMHSDEIGHGVGTRGRVGDREGRKSHSDRAFAAKDTRQ